MSQPNLSLYKRFSYDAQNILTKVEVASSFNPFSCVNDSRDSPWNPIQEKPRYLNIQNLNMMML